MQSPQRPAALTPVVPAWRWRFEFAEAVTQFTRSLDIAWQPERYHPRNSSWKLITLPALPAALTRLTLAAPRAREVKPAYWGLTPGVRFEPSCRWPDEFEDAVEVRRLVYQFWVRWYRCR